MSKEYIEAFPYMQELHEKFATVLYEHSDLLDIQKEQLLKEFDRILNPNKAVAQLVGIDGRAEQLVFDPQIRDDEYGLLVFEK